MIILRRDFTQNICRHLKWRDPNFVVTALQWRHNERNDSWNHRRIDCLLNRLFRRRSKKTSKLRVTGLRGGNSPVTGEFPKQRAGNAEHVSILWRHHGHADVLAPKGVSQSVFSRPNDHFATSMSFRWMPMGKNLLGSGGSRFLFTSVT